MSDMLSQRDPSRCVMSRRQALKGIGIGAASALMAACGAAAPPSASPGSNASEAPATTDAPAPDAPVTVRLQARTGTQGEYYTRQIEAFHGAQDRVRVELELTPPPEYGQKLTTLVAGGQLGDGFWNGILGQFYPFAARGLNADLIPLAEAANIDLGLFFPTTIEQLTIDGKLYGWPQGTHAGWSVLYVNITAWEQAGAPLPAWEWTYENEWLAAVEAATQDKPGFTIDMGTGAIPQATYTLIRSWGGDWIDPNDRSKSTINSEATTGALLFLHDLIYEHQVHPTPDGFVAQPAHTMFTGELANSYANGVFANGPINTAVGDKFAYDGFSMPAGPGGRGSFLGADSLCISRSSANPAAMFEFYQFLTSREASLAQVDAGLSAPARIDAWEDPKLAEPQIFQVTRQWLEITQPFTAPANARVGEFTQAFAQGMQAFLLEQNDPLAAIESMHEAVQAVLDKPQA